MPSPILYYVTDRAAFPGGEPARRRALLEKIAEAARSGVDYLQIREKDLSARDLESLAWAALTTIREAAPRTANRNLRPALLINSRTDVSVAVGADGVHLPADDVSPSEARDLWKSRVVVGVSCHSAAQVDRARQQGADYVLFAPVFEKKNAPTKPAGLEGLRWACRYGIPVFALGGVTVENARTCLEAGASGIAGIRLFQERDIAEVVRRMRG